MRASTGLSLLTKIASPKYRTPLIALFVAAIPIFLATFDTDSRIASASAQELQNPIRGQSQEDADRKSSGCISCHTATDEPTMHPSQGVHLGCTDCHGGNVSVTVAVGTAPNSPEYRAAKEKAHVQPRQAIFKNRSTIPERAYAAWLQEPAEYVKFVNPGDLRVAPETCGSAGCHPSETRAVSTNIMTHSGLLWGAALYNNGGIPYKNARFGESYNRDGIPQTLKTVPPPTPEETRTKGVIPETHASLPLGNFAAGKLSASLRAWRRRKSRNGQSRRAKKSGQARRQTQ